MESILETARLLIRPLTPDDAPALAEILCDPEVMRHSVSGVCDAAATRLFVARCLGFYESHGIGPWALIEKGNATLIGFCGPAPEQIDGVDEVQIGYRLARRHWGRGLATEAACAAVDHTFRAQALQSVVAMIEPDHAASQRVAAKTGFRDFRETVFHGKPVRLYRLTRSDWIESRRAARVT